MLPLYQLLFWFVIKNVIPRGQGRNQADVMDQCLMDLMDRGELINLPSIMIRHIGHIATTTVCFRIGGCVRGKIVVLRELGFKYWGLI